MHTAELALRIGLALDADNAVGASIAWPTHQTKVVHFAERREYLLASSACLWNLAICSLVVVPLATETRLGRLSGSVH